MSRQTIVSRVDAVTVYREGALVRRSAALAAPAAAVCELRLGGLPLALDDSSVRLRLTGPGAAALVATDVRVALEVPDIDAALAPPDDAELEAARHALALAKARRDQHARELARTQSLGFAPRPAGAEGCAPPPSPHAARLALLDFRAERERGLRSEQTAIERQLADAEQHVAALEDRQRRASTARQARDHELRKSVLFAVRVERGVDGAGAGPTTIELEYLVPGARWAPAWVARVDVAAGRAALALRAVVAQQTGEDWRGVALTLSTASAQRFAELPELASIRIGRRQPSLLRVGWRPPPSGVELLYLDRDRVFPRAALPAPDVEDGRRRLAAASVDAHAPYGAAESADEAAFDEQETGALPMAGAFAGAPPPPSPSRDMEVFRRMSAPKTKAKAKAKAAVPMSFTARGIAAPMPQPQRSAPPSPPPYYGEREGASDGEKSDERDAGLAPEALLAYGELRMPAADQPRRGLLTRAPLEELYLALLVEQRIEVRFDAVAVVGRAIERARAVTHASLPPGHHLDWPSDFDHAYRAEAAVDVPSDGQFHSLPILVADAPVALRWVVVPRESTDVFRVATLRNPLTAPLLSGPLDIYLGERFLLTTELRTTAPRGTVEVGLGVDQAIKVARNTDFREETAGLMRGSLLLRHTLRIEVESHAAQPVALEVRERVPVVRPGDEDVAVEIETVTPPWEDWEPFPDAPEASRLRGARRWRFELEPRGKRALRAEYAVKIGSKHELVGGNRRDG